MKCNGENNCRTCKHNLILNGKSQTMQDNVEYFIVFVNNQVNVGSKTYYYFMQRYGDVIGVCESAK